MTGEAPSSAPPSSSFRLRPNLDLLFLLGIVVLINLPYFSSKFMPAHDTKYAFGIFSYFYNHLLVEHELPRWMAYGTFGIKSAVFQFDFLSATSYVFMTAGALFRVQDPLLVFTISIVGEQVLFLLGVYLLSRRLFADRLTVFFVCLGALCGTVWYWQLMFNFRWFHLLPLTLYFLFRFTAEKRPEFLWLTGISLLLGTVGCPPYFYPLLALTLGMIVLALGSTFRSALPCLLERSWRNGLALGLFLLTLCAVGLTLHQALDGIRIATTERDPETGQVPYETFLLHGGIPSARLLGSFLGALPEYGGGVDLEVTHYLGLLPLAALPVALLRCRNRYFIALSVAAGLLLLLSLGGTFASLVFRIPLLNLFRHIGYVTSIAKLLMLIAAGFGIESMLSSASSGIGWDRRTRFAVLGVTLLLLWILLDLRIGGVKLIQAVAAAKRGDFLLPKFRTVIPPLTRAAVWLAAAAIVLWPSRSGALASFFSPAAARKALLAAVILDGFLYQAHVVSRMPVTNERIPFPTGSIAFRERRGELPDPRVQQTLREWEDVQAYGGVYQLELCSMFQLEPYRPLAREDWSSRPVAALKGNWKATEEEPLPTVLGATASKLRLVSRAVYVETEREAGRAISGSSALADQVVLRGVPPELRFVSPETASSAMGEIRVKEFSANRLVADVSVSGNHPVWLVYADSFHPGWRATVNGKSAPVAEAYLAFKGVRLEPGANRVSLSFHDGIHTVAAQLLALLSFLFAAGGFGTVAALALFKG